MPSLSTLEAVTEIVRDTLMLDDRVPAPHDRFFADLGGESIEILETEFQLQKTFNVTVSFQKAIAGGDIQIDADGNVTKEALARLAKDFPFLPFDRLPAPASAESLRDLITVASIAGFVDQALTSKGASNVSHPTAGLAT